MPPGSIILKITKLFVFPKLWSLLVFSEIEVNRM